MQLFDLDYGDLIRPPFRILRGRAWGQCTNQTEEHLVVYGPKNERERSNFRHVSVCAAARRDNAGLLGL